MHEFWLLERGAYEMMLQALSTFDMATVIKRPVEITDIKPVIKGGVMSIPVVGAMTKEGGSPLIQMIFGASTSYNSIINALVDAEADPEVKSVLLDPVDSPGGSANGIFEATKAIRNFSKPIKAIVRGQATSGAYMLAAETNEIIVQNEADILGSIGVRARFFVSDNEVIITSSMAPFKAPDPKTQIGVDAIQAELDMLHNHMVKGIAAGRDTSADIVNSEFGKGGNMTADIALRRGMIDKIGIEDAAANAAVNDINKDDKKTSKTMKTGGEKKMALLSDLLKDDPEARKEHNKAVTDASEKATADERERVVAHLVHIDHSGENVKKAIVEGTQFGQAAMSTYMEASMKHRQGKGRSTDNPGEVPAGETEGDQVDGKADVEAVVDKSLEADESASGVFG